MDKKFFSSGKAWAEKRRAETLKRINWTEFWCFYSLLSDVIWTHCLELLMRFTFWENCRQRDSLIFIYLCSRALKAVFIKQLFYFYSAMLKMKRWELDWEWNKPTNASNYSDWVFSSLSLSKNNSQVQPFNFKERENEKPLVECTTETLQKHTEGNNRMRTKHEISRNESGMKKAINIWRWWMIKFV